jgi:hypothetical protein
MEANIRKILDCFEEIGPGGKIPTGDRDAVQLYVTTLLQTGADGIPVSEAVDLVRFLQWAYWAEGWERGYDSGARQAKPAFSLNYNSPTGS